MTPDEKHIKRINKYLTKIDAIYSDLVREISLLVVKQRILDKFFRFKDYKRITVQVDKALKDYNNKLLSSINTYTEYEWDYGNAKIDDLLKTNLEKVKSKVPIDG